MTVSVGAYEQKTADFDSLDLYIASQLFINDTVNTGQSDVTWDETTQMDETVPLYDLDAAIRAYYVSLTDRENNPTGYLVVNASREAPVVLEFSFTGSLPFDAQSSKVCYGGNGLYFDYPERETRSAASTITLQSSGETVEVPKQELVDEVDTYCEQVNNSSFDKADEIAAIKQAYLTQGRVARGGDYNFVDFPSASGSLRSSGRLDAMEYKISWHTMEQFKIDYPKENFHDNCASVSGTNTIGYYECKYQKYQDQLGISTTFPIVGKMDTEIHSDLYKNYLGAGPKTPTDYYTQLIRYMINNVRSGFDVSVDTLSKNFESFRSCIDADRMPWVLVWPALFQAHYVNGVEYRIYNSGEHYFEILNNWDAQKTQFYLFQIDSQQVHHVNSMGYVEITW